MQSTRCFTTYVYCYDKIKCCVTTETVPGLVHDICGASGNSCMVFFWDQQHYMLFDYLIHAIKISDENENANVVFFCDKSHLNVIEFNLR